VNREINLAEIGTTREDPPFSTRAPHGKIKRIIPIKDST
jgi:hypothetical protein